MTMIITRQQVMTNPHRHGGHRRPPQLVLVVSGGGSVLPPPPRPPVVEQPVAGGGAASGAATGEGVEGKAELQQPTHEAAQALCHAAAMMPAKTVA